MNMSPTSMKLSQGAQIGEVTPLADVYLVETEDSTHLLSTLASSLALTWQEQSYQLLNAKSFA